MSQNIREEIIKLIKYSDNGKWYDLESVDCPSKFLHIENKVGVAVECSLNIAIYETFNNIELAVRMDGNGEKNYLVLLMPYHLNYVDEFALICENFVIGDQSKRLSLIENPFDWWEKWCEIIGNKKYDEKPYALIGELISYYWYFDMDNSLQWNHMGYGTHDLEGESMVVEVKSTTDRYRSQINVNSQYQLKKQKLPIYLSFVRCEESIDGVSLNIIIKKLKEDKQIDVMENINKLGYKIENHIFEKKYKILEMRLYEVNENFPVFDIRKYADTTFFKHVIKYEYILNLDSLSYCDINLNFLNNFN